MTQPPARRLSGNSVHADSPAAESGGRGRAARPPLRPLALLLTLLLGAVLALSGCGGGAAGGSKGTLTVSMPSPPPSLELGKLDGGISVYVWGTVYNTVVSRSLQGEIQPSAAESWSYSPDRTALTLKVRAGMTFSNGDPVTARSVAGSLEKARTGSTTQSAFTRVSTIAASDDSTVVITLSRPDPGLLDALTGIAGVVGDPAQFDTQNPLRPIGSGPYVLDGSRTTEGAVYTLTKRKDHWNAAAYPYDTIVVRVIADLTAAQNAFRAGETDAITLNDAGAAASLKSGDYSSVDSGAVAVMGFWIADRAGTKVPALADVRVRQAINLAIDRQGIVKSLLGGLGTPTTQVFAPGYAAYDASLENTYPFDRARAKGLMEQAGYGGGFDLTMPSTVLSQPFEAALAQQLADIGVRVTWTPIPMEQANAKLATGDYPLFWAVNGLSADYPAVATNLDANGSLNVFHVTDPTTASLIDTSYSALDDATRDDALRALNKYVVEQAWFAPVYQLHTITVTQHNVTYTPAVAGFTDPIRQFAPATAG